MKSVKKENLKTSNLESKSRTRQYIKTALLELMKKFPYDKITVTAIINRAGVSRAGFYRNYDSKDAVLDDIASSIYQRLYEHFICDYNVDIRQRCIALFEHLRENANWFQLVILHNSHKNHLFDISLYVKQYLKPQTSLAYYQYISLIYSQKAIIIDWFENGMKETPEEMADIFSVLFKDIQIDIPELNKLP